MADMSQDFIDNLTNSIKAYQQQKEEGQLFPEKLKEQQLKNQQLQMQVDVQKKLQEYLQEQNNQPMDATQSNNSVIQKSEPITNNYGVEIPKPTKQDIINQTMFGTNTYSDKVKAANDNIKNQQSQYQTQLASSLKMSQDATNLRSLYSRYNYWMDQANETGPILGRLPALGTASQTVDNITSQMAMSAVEQMRDAMGSARFAVADLNVALQMKAQRTWTSGTRKFYGDYVDAAEKRMNEMPSFYQVANERKVPKQIADALWQQYQQQFPIVSKEGNYIIKRTGNEWQKFLSQEAIDTITKTGNYSPIQQNHITEENIKDTMRSTNMSRKQVLEQLKMKGFDISGLER